MPDIAGACARYDDGDGEGARLAADVARRLAAWRARGRHCSACEEPHPLVAFGPDLREPDGLDRRCRASEARRKASSRVVAGHLLPHEDPL